MYSYDYAVLLLRPCRDFGHIMEQANLPGCGRRACAMLSLPSRHAWKFGRPALALAATGFSVDLGRLLVTP